MREKIVEAIVANPNRKGVSRQTIKKYILSKYKTCNATILNKSITSAIAAGAVARHHQHAGSFKVVKKAAPKKKKTVKKKKTTKKKKATKKK
eukprot:g1208.t1